MTQSAFIFADAAFCAGTSHVKDLLPCQDYGASSVRRYPTNQHPYAAISDGCSTAGIDEEGSFVQAKTDFGARIAVSQFQCMMERRFDWQSTSPTAINMLAGHVKKVAYDCGLGASDLMATLNAVYIKENSRPTAYMLGDGVVAVRFRSGKLRVIDVDWVGSMPPYVEYFLTPDTYTQFAKLSQQAAADASREPCIITAVDIDQQLPDALMVRGSPAFDVASRGLFFNWDPDDVEVVAVFSDGIKQIKSATGETMPIVEAVGRCMAFTPARRGEFVRRQLRATLRAFAAKGFIPEDDLSMGAISIDPSI